MTRRRLILAACVAAVALWAAWWLFAGGLSADERRLVGTWQASAGTGAQSFQVWTFQADRTFDGLFVSTGPNQWSLTDSGVWRVRGNSLIFDREASLFHHAVQSLRRMLGLYHHQAVCGLEWLSSDQIVVTSGGAREVFTRDRRD